MREKREVTNLFECLECEIIPILLTVISTILGFIPFLIGSNVADFWISLAIGTMSGLIFLYWC